MADHLGRRHRLPGPCRDRRATAPGATGGADVLKSTGRRSVRCS